MRLHHPTHKNRSARTSTLALPTLDLRIERSRLSGATARLCGRVDFKVESTTFVFAMEWLAVLAGGS